MISIDRLDKTFNRGKQNAIHVVNDVSLELPASGMVAIFGRSGCGKTTLLNVIGGLDRVQSGSVEIDGEKMTVSNDSLRNRSVGYIFQNYLLNREQTCRENVADALRLLGVTDREFIETQVDAALSAVGMERFAARLPDTLSGGQQQRIAIARAIVKNPPVILADEPTGNLDEANTLHVMRLLKAISRDRLVLLVTHEENLVSAFSDRVIELSDGRVVSDRVNVPTEGYTGYDKNAVYLGELPHKTLLDGDGVKLDLYGDASSVNLKSSPQTRTGPGATVPPAADVKLRLVYAPNGQIYLKVDSGKVSVLDESSEVRLENGVAPKAGEKPDGTDDLPDLSAIKPVKGARPGRLFGFLDAWKSGVRANLGQKKRGRKVLRAALILFAAVVVFMTASLGVFVRKLADVDGTYHHHVIYAYAGDETSAAALSALGEQDGIIFRQLSRSYPYNERTISFNVGNFETFGENYFGYALNASGIKTTGVAFLRSAAAGRQLLAGKNAGLSDDDALISEGAAKALIKSSTYNYLNGYDDLIGLCSTSDGFRIAGVVSGDDREIFLSTSKMIGMNNLNLYVSSILGGFAAPEDGYVSVILPYQPSDADRLPKAGDRVKINGKTMTVDRVIRDRNNEPYPAWCLARYGVSPEINYPLTFAGAEAYLSHFSEYVSEKAALFGTDDLMTYLFTAGIRSDALYWADQSNGTVIDAEKLLAYRQFWRAAHPGEADPTEDELQEWTEQQGDPGTYLLYEQRRDELLERYSDLYYKMDVSRKADRIGYFLSDAEAEAAFSRVGKTTLLDGYYYYYYDANPPRTGDEIIPELTYLTIRTNDPEKTAARIEAVLGDHYRALEGEGSGIVNEWNPAVYTPDDFRQEALRTEKADIIANAIELAVFIAVMSLCMYLMMRASLMGRIREIGIYRAIGVSKKNLVFRFFIESLAVTSLTVLIGYLFSSLLISAWLVKAPLIGEYFYYPLWMALAALGLLYAISALCGTLPVLRLLRKTPSEILSKYDI